MYNVGAIFFLKKTFMEKYIAEIVFIAIVITANFMRELRAYYKSKGKIFYFNENLEVDVQIQKELKHIVDKYGFNRASIIKYHNGMESFDGFSFNYATMTHEETDDGTAKMLDRFQKIPLTSFAEALKLLKDSPEHYHVVNSDHSNPGIMQAGWHVKQSWNFMLSDRISSGIVCLAMSYSAKSLTDEQILEIRSVVYKINMLMNKKR